MPRDGVVTTGFPHTKYRPTLAPLVDAVISPFPRRGRRHWLFVLGLVMVVTIFAGRALVAARAASVTIDEGTYLSRGLFAVATAGDAMFWRLGSPRLPHLLSALPSYVCLRYAKLLPESTEYQEFDGLLRSGEILALWPARWVAVGWGISLLLLTYHGVAMTRGAAAGLVACALLSMVPEVLAHSAIAGCDLPFACSAMLAVIALARYAERPTVRRWLGVTVCVGFSWAIRHSAVLLILVAALVHLVSVQRRVWPEGWRVRARGLIRSAAATFVLSSCAFLVLWAGDGFGLVSASEAVDQRPSGSMSQPAPSHTDAPRRLVPTSLASFLRQLNHQKYGHQAFLCGAKRWDGFRTYFAVAMVLKTPVGLLALLIVAVARSGPFCRFSTLCATLLLLTWVVLIQSRVNIGVRYALLTYPLVVPFVARLFEPNRLRDRLWGPVVCAALVWFLWASAAAHPRYLSYFNELGGGPHNGWLYLADSNIDWGQDYGAMLAALKKRGIREVTTSVFSSRWPQDPDVRVTQIPPKGPVAVLPPNTRSIPQAVGRPIPIGTRYVAVSATHLHCLYSDRDLFWLWTRRLVERVGASIWIFDMDTAADRPFFL
jgi:hypothetical protein